MEPLPLPPYSPEPNPAEQVFRHLRARLSNRVFDNLDDLEAAITEALSDFWQQPQTLQSLTGYPWWIEAAEAIRRLASSKSITPSAPNSGYPGSYGFWLIPSIYRGTADDVEQGFLSFMLEQSEYLEGEERSVQR